jgi:NAD(P)-dependent dehydrogenase (short-subunit alcohol dehydrogenase family)
MAGICDGRVVIITGAGGGLGREYALAFAKEGASVVINDINPAAAERTVGEIGAMGGKAIANSNDITNHADAGLIVKAAIDAFGDLHVVVNNAGICRDRMFVSLSEQDWDEVIRVHLKGHFCISSHACNHWRGQAKDGKPVSGRIINTSSGAGLQGSIGQSNYSAAKGGIASLTLVQAAELRRYNITANALAPSARTGMTAGVFDDMMKKPEDGSFDYYDPANVAPLVVWLGSELSGHVTGRVFEVEGGRIAIADGWRSTTGVDKKARWAPAEVTGAMEQLLATEVSAQKVFGT